jgi:hypothetical protein
MHHSQGPQKLGYLEEFTFARQEIPLVHAPSLTFTYFIVLITAGSPFIFCSFLY